MNGTEFATVHSPDQIRILYSSNALSVQGSFIYPDDVNARSTGQSDPQTMRGHDLSDR